MCGVAGIYYFNEKPPQARRTVGAMASAIAHRGRDDTGLFENECLVLAHQRLSIIDLQTGHQPMSNEDGSIVVAFNGEIYNYKDLRRDLQTRGHIFSTTSDTEVLVHLYEDLGLAMFDRLNGIFAFALWDNRAKKLLLARDHFGVKPLHIYHDNGRVLFASEIKAILADADITPRMNKQSVHYFMNLRYVPGKATLFDGIERLMAGEYVVVNQEGLRRAFYCTAPRFGGSHLTESEAIAGVKGHLSTAVSRQLVSDVPVGIYLSGGMDSSSVLAMTQRAQRNEKIDTYTLGFNEPTDELDDAKRLAGFFQTRNHALSVDPEPLKQLPEVLWHVEEPKINMLQGFLLARHARQYTKVALAGLGGDELFAGYLAYQYLKPSEPFHRLVPTSLVKAILQPTLRRCFGLNRSGMYMAADEYLRGLQMLLSVGDKCQYYAIIRNAWDHVPHMASQIYGPRMQDLRLQRTRTVFEPYFADKQQSFVEQALMAEFQTKLVDDFLLNEDRVSMAHGLEVRVPFLDRDLVSFATQLPIHMKLRGLTTKYIFKKAMKGMVPDFVLEKRKWGFAFNAYYQFQKDLKQTAQRILTRKRVESLGLFNYSFVKKVINHPPHPRMRWHYFTLWMMVGFHIWHEMFMANAFPKSRFDLEAYMS